MSLDVNFASKQAALHACRRWHYSGSLPNGRQTIVGAWEDGSFRGVVVFGRGANKDLGTPYGLDQTGCCELIRIAFREHRAPISQVVSQAFKLLRSSSPGLRLVISFADPEQEHIGGIYQAGNWVYLGRTNASYRYITPDGTAVHRRNLSKSGWMNSFGTQSRCWRFDQCQKVKIQGKHRYAMPLDRAMRRQLLKLAQPYPKCTGSVEGDALAVQAGEGGSTPTPVLHPSRPNTDAAG